MKKKFFFIILMLSFIYSCENISGDKPQTQNLFHQKDTSQILQVRTETTDSSKNIPKELIIEKYIPFREQNSQFIISRFYPVGWSEEGLFAYAIEPPDEACGCYFFEFYIKNLNTQQLLWEFKFETQYDYDLPIEEQIDFKRFWQSREAFFNSKLDSLGIIRDFSAKKMEFPIKIDKQKILNPELKTKYTKDQDASFGFEFMTHLEINLSVSSLKKQSIYKKTFDEFGPIESSILGYLQNPFGNQIAILLETTYRGWEGPPHPINIEIVGINPKSYLH
ncbi:MAG: hypothetical protein NW226_16695 [Microscillaceae bacterium]|nr:hypothetical protein [Microscillaceae bacterium]